MLQNIGNYGPIILMMMKIMTHKSKNKRIKNKKLKIKNKCFRITKNKKKNHKVAVRFHQHHHNKMMKISIG